MSPTTTHLKEGKANSLVFAGVNFNIYKVRIQAKLRGKGLWKVVSGEDTRDYDADDDDEFDSKEDKAFDILVNSLDDDNLAYVSHVTTSKEVWDLLVTRYEARTYADVSHVIHELNFPICLMSKQASNPLRETITPSSGSDGQTPVIGVSTNPGQEVGVGNALLPNPGVSNPLLTPNPSPSLLVANHLALALVGQGLRLLCMC
ncbi:Aste57867_5470 [Aphanomyces stellatus]|uniref:Aste57867_5470 protein n=1 Tax=Aphanomyces stellatus TaxID=120398 RepID=A0A485KEM0_9STRA|nr:hypothetical protein As57867_005457 [Aphanomyces stellatus]VFT82522.1 Aste57867_5470 [Aphanomyces stellatus]